ncbi:MULTISPECIES: signal recognition particle-docking protein FtsY [unclassified Cyanobium]|uniref:signal recognition particle-docking protein FtsY n=1 Tax=unclassified Cyanobium TaxID=2627006 RepID=UPI0020CE1840|nr:MULTISPECIES: signal recognition particle-docking protein FtsY [unclassified Cyanobium]MCP9776478.1 signal recognition particle-docking protein FtsY [Cyanobium sp. Tous-M-B4]MCP9876158.1 signal recognition particle-docking protein FtsY [Cyanobium sp. A2C-AMD]
MVYDWFNRTGPSPADPSATPAPASEQVSGQAPDQAPEQPLESSSDPNAEALEWARQAYARLKAQQEEQKRLQLEAESAAESPLPDSVQPVQVNSQQPEQVLEQDLEQVAQAATPVAAPLSLLEQAAAQRAERQQAITASEAPALEAPAAPELAEPSLGAFDTTFTWSAEVLAAQGKRVDQVSLEEIDWLARLRQGLEKTRQGLVTQLLDNLGDDPLTPEVVDGLETTLLRADVGVEATDRALGALRQRLNQEVVDPAEGLRFLKEQLRAILDQPIEASGQPLLAPRREQLNVWLLVGVNGVGKTTTLGKLANLAVRSGYSCLIAAADTFRAAAVQQVQVWGERSKVPVIANPSANADPAAVVYDAIGAAQAKGTELVLVDTAGRLQTKHNLMEELSKVRRIVDKLAPEAVVESLLVLDASQGQNGLRQAMAFAKAAGLTGVVLTKLDGSARGGVALAVASEAGLPIRFIGAGEGIRDLRPFNSFEFVEALLAR